MSVAELGVDTTGQNAKAAKELYENGSCMPNVETSVVDHIESSRPVSLSLQDLLDAESEVLKRVARDNGPNIKMAGHYSMSSGHRMTGTHTSHVSAKADHPLED